MQDRTPTHKLCKKCNITKPASAFSRRSDRPIGLYGCCKKCKAAYRSKKYRATRTSHLHWAQRTVANLRDRAKRKLKIACNLTAQDLVELIEKLDSKCAYCRQPFNMEATHANRDKAPSVDRVFGGGYLRGKVTLCCYKCNRSKNDSTLSELKVLVAGIERVSKDLGLQ